MSIQHNSSSTRLCDEYQLANIVGDHCIIAKEYVTNTGGIDGGPHVVVGSGGYGRDQKYARVT